MATTTAEKSKILFEEDFSKFKIGDFPYDNDHTAIGEYHYFAPEGYYGGWYDTVVNYRYCGTGPSWIITENSGRHYMESMRIEKNIPHRIFPTLMTGCPHWKNVKIKLRLRRLSTKGMAGIFFGAIDSLNGLVFTLENRDKAVLSYRYKEELTVIKEIAFPHGADDEYELTVDRNGTNVVCYINGESVIDAEINIPLGGKIGLTADCPTRFASVTVLASDDEDKAITERKRLADEAEREAIASHPKMKLVKKIDLKNFGTSRQLRIGRLNGTDEVFIVLAQMQKRVHQDAYGSISCLTAIDLEGNILWQIGEATEDAQKIGKICADMPFQVYDIDGDGCDEVIYAKDFEIMILDGKSGKVKKSAKTPQSDDDDGKLFGPPYGIYAYDRINPDGIRICNFRGRDRASDILIKDRYDRVYALDNNLNLMWKYRSSKNTGHCPLPVDINGDGCDELLVGYTMLDKDGHELWTYPIENDHTDEIVMGKFRGDGKGYFACVSGAEGFFIGDMHGNIVARDYIGHAQRVSVARYCEDRDDFQIAVVNYWGHQGIIYLYDANGNQLWEYENGANGNLVSPVNWDGSGRELILTNANADLGGLLNGNGVLSVIFPDDGHPDMCCEAVDILGDGRDEIITWDYKSLWIYTQDDNPKPQTYRPVKFPDYNASNYRGEFAYPDDSYLKFSEN